MAQSIETTFQAAIDAGKINGVVVCATDSKGHFVYNTALGQRTLLSGEKQPQRLDDVLFLASATKLITSIATLQCVEDGLLTLTGDLSSVAPELANKQILTGFSEDGKTPLLEPATGPITIEQLLTHSSGITYEFLNPSLRQWIEKFNPPVAGVRRSVEEHFSQPLTFQPGKGWMYSPGLDWAGRIVERVTGKTLGQRMEERIWAPLGIDDAQFYPVTREEVRARMVDLNPDDPEGTGRAVFGGGGDPTLHTKGDFGGHGLFTSAASYVKVLHSLLANDGVLLKPATVDDMFANHLRGEAAEGHDAAVASPMGMFFRRGLEPGTKTGYGLGGLLALQDVPDWHREGTMGWGGGMTLGWFIDRKKDLCGIGAIQASIPRPLPFDESDKLQQLFSRDLYRKHSSWKEGQR